MQISEVRTHLQNIEAQLQHIGGQLEDREDDDSGPVVPLTIAIQSLRTLYRSLRLEEASSSKSEGSEDYAGRLETSNYKLTCRKLSRSEESMRDSCCEFIQAYMKACQANLESLSDDHACAVLQDLE